MSTKLKTRRSHLAKFVSNVAAQAIDNAQITSRTKEDERRLLKLRPHAYLLMARMRKGTYEGWNMLALRCNIGNYVANRYYLPGPQEHIKAALVALTKIHARFLSMDRIGMTDDEVNIIHAALCIIDELQDDITPAQWSAATMYIFEIAGVIT